ncbi:MAG TPA: glycoside hydrolase family 2 TIM barrel-domain containing protein [bacterium]|nr:glycoside hydrolase family 2 TIM barrel-domain containing protein [bacterium]
MRFRALKMFLALGLIAAVAVADPGAGSGLEIREVGPVPVLWEQGMPYFTRFSESDHGALDLAGAWKFRPDPDDRGAAEGWFEPALDDADWYDHPVPGSWNARREEWLDCQGAGWYRTRFTAPAGFAGRFNRLVFDGVTYQGDVYMNGKLIGSHHGGFSRWSVDVSDALDYGAENSLAMRVDNRRHYDSLPGLKSPGGLLGWWPYGGIHRLALVESGPEMTLVKVAADTDMDGGLSVKAVVYNHGAPARAEVRARLTGLDGREIAVLDEEELDVAGQGLAAFGFDKKIAGVKPWSPQEPGNRYRLEISVSGAGGGETQAIEIGFRTFEFRGAQAYLNGRPVFLRGVNRHEDYPESGPVLSDRRIHDDMALLHELHVNFMRPAHYPNDPRWLDACDREGIMITEEIPHYQLGATPQSARAVMGGPLFDDAATALIETIERDRNHPAMVMWSIGNENATVFPHVRRFHQRLYNMAKRFDVRPVTFAISTSQLTPMNEITAGIGDCLFLNEYFGWYHSRIQDLGPFLDQVHKRWPNKPVVVSEFGAGAAPGLDGKRLYPIGGLSRDFTEDYQSFFHRETLAQILARPWITGTMPWVFADFRDDKRPRNPIKDFNLKGLVTYDRQRKKAFYVVRDVYSEIEKEEDSGRRLAWPSCD